MGWSCRACTYDNSNDGASSCEICETGRREWDGSAAKVETATEIEVVADGERESERDSECCRPTAIAATTASTAVATGTKTETATRRNRDAYASNAHKNQKKGDYPAALVQRTLLGTRAVAPKAKTKETVADDRPRKRQKQTDPKQPAEVAAAGGGAGAAAASTPGPNHKTSSTTTRGVVPPSEPMDSTSFSGVFRAPFFQLPLERRVEIAMERVFGIQKLRPLQAKVIRHVLRTATTSGGNGSRSSYGSSSNSVSSSSLPASSPPSTCSPCRFQIAVMATGAGKSLCYQLPAVVLGGTTVVVTPLVALMEDQVRSLQRKGVAAEMIASNKPPEHNRAVLDRLVGRAAPVTAAQPAGKRSNSSNNNTNSNRPIPISCLYCTPEQIRRPQFRSVLLEMHRNRRPSRNKDSINPYRLSILAVDEAHCISQWGHDFRPAFRDELQWLASNLMGVPVLACTATATPAVLKDIQVGLLLGNADNFERKGNEASTRGGGSGGCRILVGDLDRPNLFYRVAYVDALLPVAQAAASKERLRPASFDPGRDEPANRVDGQHSVGIGPHRAHLLTHLERMHAKLQQQGLPCAGIVYCRKREQTLDVAGWINEAFDHARQPPASDRRSEAASSSFPPPPPPNRTLAVFVRAVAYHGGMSAADRAVAQESWTKGESDVVVATSAFGMGIDVSHVRYVVHFSLPQSIEAFYQESGRAGRDGEPAHSLLYASHQDIRTLRYIVVSQQEANRKKKQHSHPQTHHHRQPHKVAALEKMIEYAMTLTCRRRYLLQHFGVDGDDTDICQGKCDYCSHPDKVRRAREKASVAAAQQQYNPFRIGPHPPHRQLERNGFTGAHDGDDGTDDSDCDRRHVERARATGLRLSASASDWHPAVDEENGYAIARPRGDTHVKATLAKYEAIELQQNQGKGFVHFKRRGSPERGSSLSSSLLRVPEHFRKIVPRTSIVAGTVATNTLEARSIAQAHPPSDIPAQKPSSDSYATEAERLQAELQVLRAHKEAAANRRDALAKAIAVASFNPGPKSKDLNSL